MLESWLDSLDLQRAAGGGGRLIGSGTSSRACCWPGAGEGGGGEDVGGEGGVEMGGGVMVMRGNVEGDVGVNCDGDGGELYILFSNDDINRRI